MSPLFGEQVTEGSGAVRTGQQSEYERWLRECWSEELGRELTPAEIEARKRGRLPNIGTAENARPASPVSNPNEHHFQIAGTRYRSKAEADAEERAMCEEEQRRKDISARQAAFLLEDELERDERRRLGLE